MKLHCTVQEVFLLYVPPEVGLEPLVYPGYGAMEHPQQQQWGPGACARLRDSTEHLPTSCSTLFPFLLYFRGF